MSQVHHPDAGPLTFELTALGSALLFVGSHIQAGMLVIAAVDFSQAAADAAHWGSALMALVAAGTFTLNVADRIKGRRRPNREARWTGPTKNAPPTSADGVPNPPPPPPKK